MNLFNFLRGGRTPAQGGGWSAGPVHFTTPFGSSTRPFHNPAFRVSRPMAGGPLAAAAANLPSPRMTNPQANPQFDWSNQLRRLSAALYDADPANPGRGHLSAYDDQRQLRARESHESERRRADLAGLADQMGLGPDERAMLLFNPMMWLQLYGPVHRQRMGVPMMTNPDFASDE